MVSAFVGGRVGDDVSQWHNIVRMSKTVATCTFSFRFIKFVLDFLWMGQNCKIECFAATNVLFRVPAPSYNSVSVSLVSSRTKFANFVEDLACEGFAPHSSTHVLPKFWKVLWAVFACFFLCVQLPWN